MRLLIVLLLVLWSVPVGAQTVRDIAERNGCSTAGIEGLSRQLAEEQMCMRPGAFVRFAPHPGITLTSSRVHPFAQETATRAIQAAAAREPLSINSAFRTIADQYVLFDGCSVAARPGRSNHQSGRAIDVQFSAAVRSALEAEGCVWFGSSDRVHFDCPGADQRRDSVLAFQRLWNRNNPSDRIAEDGSYGTQTAARLARSPAGGFGVSGCEGGETCAARCEADGWVDASCQRRACSAGEMCEMAPEPRCVAPDIGPGGGSLLAVVHADLGRGEEDRSVRIPAAEVRLLETGVLETADTAGLARFATGAGPFTIEATAEGFSAGSAVCEVAATAEPTWCYVGLTNEVLETGTLRGVVYDEAGGIRERVLEARVEVRGVSRRSVSVDPEDGSFSFELPPGEYTAEAMGETFESGAATCLVAGGDTTWCSIGVRGEVETRRVDEPVPDNGGGLPESMGRGIRDDDDGGGCGAGGAGGPMPALALVALLAWRRRRD